ncbi:hypothetical protein JAAARDRAFT_33349 [Jaapia argillacea MUCL 33604]|uniref:Cytochrome P450 n=1 Tax=Jaapia argillacea MUCL 33604 TaxID=933084 RepID=A0A067Q0W6_9AGAM|nr:hypothetical protein JAAARDRAFT_33349 [Jaapia argillacea MUCL 33604]
MAVSRWNDYNYCVGQAGRPTPFPSPTVMLWKSIGALLVIFVVSRVVRYALAVRKFGHLPGVRSLFGPLSLLGSTMPTSNWNPGLNWQWVWRKHVYKDAGSETISFIPYLFGQPTIATNSLEVARQITSMKMPFVKPQLSSLGIIEWGRSVFSENGDEWKRHRKILNPAFGSSTHALVWEESVSTFREMSSFEGWNEVDTVKIPAMNALTTKFALIIISKCGFGNNLPWDFSSPTGEMSFAEALTIVTNALIARLIIPRWMYRLPIPKIQQIDLAFKSLRRFMRSLIDTRREEMAADGKEFLARRDVFSMMVRASESEGKHAMTDDELTGNTFLMLFAGHETTAHTLDAAIGFLALYPEIQDEVYAQIKEVAPDGAQPKFQDFSKLNKVQGAFLEAARLFPAGLVLHRETTEDVVLTTYGEGGATNQLPLERGTWVNIDIVGIHYNPRHFPDPEEYRPSRWYHSNENDLSMFSLGPRACIGRRFALTEGVCFLTLLLQQWRLEIILNDGETRSQWRERVMRGFAIMSLGVGKVPVRLVRRS